MSIQGILAILLVIIFISIFSYKAYKKEYYKSTFSETTCVCVFDIDATITCGEDNARTAIKECKKRNCKLALNTARTQPYYSDLNFNLLNLEKEDIKNDVYHGDCDKKNMTHSEAHFNNEIANTKVKHLNTIQQKYNVPKNRIILFDDIIHNVTAARDSGFSAIHANSPACGLDQHVKSDISRILE
jgi:hypothetical protein